MRQWAELFEPRRTEPGWEFDLLRALPAGTAAAVYQRAALTARLRMMAMWRWWAWFGACMAATAVSMGVVWVAAAALGFGPGGRLLLEVVFHASAGTLLIRPLVRHWQGQELPYIRAALADELMVLVKEELFPRHPPDRRRHARPVDPGG